MKKFNQLKGIITTIVFMIMMKLASIKVFAEGEESGVNEQAWWDWINSYLDPGTRILYGVIPVALVIYLLLKAIDWFKKDAQGEQVSSYWSTVSKGVTVAIVAVSINTILKIVSIATR